MAVSTFFFPENVGRKEAKHGLAGAVDEDCRASSSGRTALASRRSLLLGQHQA